MPIYDVWVEHEVSNFHVGSIYLDPQWVTSHFHFFSSINNHVSLPLIYQLEHSDRKVPVPEYNISIVLDRIINDENNKNYIILTLEEDFFNGCLDQYRITGYLDKYPRVIDDKITIDIEAISVSHTKIISS